MVYLATFGCFYWWNMVNVGKYTIHGFYGIWIHYIFGGMSLSPTKAVESLTLAHIMSLKRLERYGVPYKVGPVANYESHTSAGKGVKITRSVTHFKTWGEFAVFQGISTKTSGLRLVWQRLLPCKFSACSSRCSATPYKINDWLEAHSPMPVI